MAGVLENRHSLVAVLLAALLVGVLIIALPPAAPPPPPPAACQGDDDATQLPICKRSDLEGLLPNTSVSWRYTGTVQANAAGQFVRLPPVAQLEMRTCQLRRFTPQQARACLANKPLIMIGDSMTRYQYLSLVHWLEFGEWPPPHRGDSGHPSPLIEREWAGWPIFFQGTTSMFRGKQKCHCYRVGWDQREDRFYEAGDVAAHYYMWLGTPLKPVLGRWGFPPFSNASACAPGECGGTPDWSLPLDKALRQVVSLFKPATLVLNSGLWRSKTDPVWPPEVFDAIFEAGRSAVAPQGGRAIWKTTTWAIDKRVPREWDDAALPYAAKHGWEVMDAFMLTQPAAMMQPPPYADDIHFLGQPYAELNYYLLNMIC